jgi:Fibronectin type III domain
MNSRFRLVAVLSLAMSLLVAGSSSAGKAAKPVRLADATVIVELNATDGDAGLQVFLDGEPWRAMKVFAPNGRTILDLQTRGRLRGYGLTELFSESSEPSFNVFPLAKFKALFPPGRYTFAGTTVKGKRVTGVARLSHAIPDGPKITSPASGARIDRSEVVARWNAVRSPRRIVIKGYRAIVTREDPLRVFSADLPATATSVTIPSEFLEPGTQYKLEVQAIERSGNQTLTEVAFRVRP